MKLKQRGKSPTAFQKKVERDVFKLFSETRMPDPNTEFRRSTSTRPGLNSLDLINNTKINLKSRSRSLERKKQSISNSAAKHQTRRLMEFNKVYGLLPQLKRLECRQTIKRAQKLVEQENICKIMNYIWYL